MLDKWVDATSKGRTNLPPDKVPWKAIQTLLAQVSQSVASEKKWWPDVTTWLPTGHLRWQDRLRVRPAPHGDVHREALYGEVLRRRLPARRRRQRRQGRGQRQGQDARRDTQGSGPFLLAIFANFVWLIGHIYQLFIQYIYIRSHLTTPSSNV